MADHVCATVVHSKKTKRNNDDVHMGRATAGIKTERSRPRRRTEKGAPCLRTTCGKSLRCETEKRVRSIVSSHVHMCVAVLSHTHMQTRRENTRECVSTAYAYARLFFSLGPWHIVTFVQIIYGNWRVNAGNANKLVVDFFKLPWYKLRSSFVNSRL